MYGHIHRKPITCLDELVATRTASVLSLSTKHSQRSHECCSQHRRRHGINCSAPHIMEWLGERNPLQNIPYIHSYTAMKIYEYGRLFIFIHIFTSRLTCTIGTLLLLSSTSANRCCACMVWQILKKTYFQRLTVSWFGNKQNIPQPEIRHHSANYVSVCCMYVCAQSIECIMLCKCKCEGGARRRDNTTEEK